MRSGASLDAERLRRDPLRHLRTVAAKPIYNVGQSRSGASSDAERLRRDPLGHLRTVAAKPTYNVGQSRSGAASRQMRNGSGATRFSI
jgi:hypothetical protein